MLSIVMVEDYALYKDDKQFSDIKNAFLDEPLDSYREEGSNLPPSTSDSYLNMEGENFHLGFWDKLGLMAIGTAIVCITLCVVVCTVGPGCYIYSWISKAIS